MRSTHEIAVEPLTVAAFEPFGVLLEAFDPPSFDLPTKSLHRFPWQTDSQLILQIIRFKRQPFTVRKIEKHMHVTEARMHIGGSPTVIVVAVPSETVPLPEELRAFRLEGQGVMFKPGTWHAIDAFPLGDEPGQFLFLSDKETQSELFDSPVPDPIRSVIHDFEADAPNIAIAAG